MIQAGSAKVEWNPDKKHWQIVIQVGAEFIRRQCTKTTPDAGDDELVALAIQTALDEGYALDKARVTVARAAATP